MPFSFPIFLVLLTFVLMSIALGLKFYEWWRRREMSAMLKTATEGPANPSTEPRKRPMGTSGGKSQWPAWALELASVILRPSASSRAKA